MTSSTVLAPRGPAAVRSLVALWGALRERVARRGSDLGASAIEFAIIAAVVVVAASVVGGVVYGIVSSKTDQLDKCAKQAVGAASCGVGGGAPAVP